MPTPWPPWLICARYPEKLYEVPDESARTHTAMGLAGRVTPGLDVAMSLSFQVVISPSKMPASAAPVRLMGLVMPSMLVGMVTAPSSVGK